MSLDLFTITVVTALVIVVCAVVYLVETLLRKDGASGRLWAVAFITGILTVSCYLVWAIDPSAFIAVALGNGGFVSTAGFIWLGARAFNGRRLRVAGAVLAAIVLIVVVAAFAAGPGGGDWAGAVPMFLGNAALAALGAIETRRGALRAHRNAVGLTAVLALEALFFAARTIAFVVAGPDSDVFRTWFDSRMTSLLTITLTIVAVVATSVLRAGESQLRGQRETYALHVALDGILTPDSFRSATSTLLERAEGNGESVCLLALRLDDLDRMVVAFGPGEAEALAEAWRTGVRRYAPTASLVGDASTGGLLCAFLTTSFSDVRRTASILHRRLLDDFAGLGLSVIPVVGVGIALSDPSGHDYGALVRRADEAARRSASSPDATVMLAER